MMHPLTHYRNLNTLSMEAFADAVGASKGMVSKWERWLSRPNERYMQRIFEVTLGAVTPNDFYRIKSPASSSAGDDVGASVTPPAQKGAPTVCQGRAEVARLAHNQEVAGSNPAPATSSNSLGNLPSGEAGAQFMGISCVPASDSSKAVMK